MKRKHLLITSLAGATALIVTGCGSSGDVTPSGKVKIKVDCQYGKSMRGLLSTFADEFNASQKKYEVSVDPDLSGTYNDIFKAEKTMLQDKATDGWGDLVVCYPDHVVDYMLDFRAAANIDKNGYDLYKDLSEKDLADLSDTARDQYDIDFPRTGKFVLPFSTSTECMFYNPIILGLSLGADVNEGKPITRSYINKLTWDEFCNVFCPALLEYNKTATKKIIDTSGDYSVLSYRDDNNFFITLIEQYGYSYTSVDPTTRQASLDFNTPEVKNLMKKFNGWKNQHYITSDGAVGGNQIGKWFKDRKTLFYVGSTGGITYTQESVGTEFEIECGRLPQASNEEGRQKMISQGGSWCILEHEGKNKAARVKGCWEFYKYITEPNQCARWAATSGYYPIRRSTVRSAAWGKLIDELDEDGEQKQGIDLLTARNAAYCADYDDILFTSAVFKGSSAARDQAESLMTLILKSSVSECASKIDGWFNDAINEIKKVMA